MTKVPQHYGQTDGRTDDYAHSASRGNRVETNEQYWYSSIVLTIVLLSGNITASFQYKLVN